MALLYFSTLRSTKLFSRLKRGKHKRPLIADKNDDELKEFIIKALEGRMIHYAKAKSIFKSDMLDNEAEKSDTAQRFINKFNITAL